MEGVSRLNSEQLASIKQVVDAFLSMKGWCFFEEVEKQSPAILHQQDLKDC
jgi:hypothetical protein